MKIHTQETQSARQNGSALILAVMLLLMLSIFSLGVLKSAEGAHVQAVRHKRESAARAAAQAAYEKAVFAMSQEPDLLSTLAAGPLSAALNFPDSQSSYTVNLAAFMQAKPVYRITAVGQSGTFDQTIQTYVIQAVNGWAMGRCQIPTGATSLTDVNFVNGEKINMPIEINKLNDSPDLRDIKITGNPSFLQPVNVSESRRSSVGVDKYRDVMSTFKAGIFFDQPQIRVVEEEVINAKINRFKNNTNTRFSFTPVAAAPLPNRLPAVHLEFFVQNGRGKVRITNHCTIRGFKQAYDNRTYDFKIKPGSGGDQFERYLIYAYHVRSSNADDNGDRFIVPLEETYVSQDFGGLVSIAGGQIFVDGNVILGCRWPDMGPLADMVQGQITVAATGNIWVGNSITVSDYDDLGNHYPRKADGLPSDLNPNILGLVAKGVIKVVDPGMSAYSYVDGSPIEPPGYEYVPIGLPDNPFWPNSKNRNLPDPIIVEASLTIGGGGWGAENVKRSYYGGRKENGGVQDTLILRGNITESIRGVVGITNQDGYLKEYHWDPRLQTGILPGNIWLKGKFVPVPGGWNERQIVQNQE